MNETLSGVCCEWLAAFNYGGCVLVQMEPCMAQPRLQTVVYIIYVGG